MRLRATQPAEGPSSKRIAGVVTRSTRRAQGPLPQAPPLREVYLSYPIDQLEQGFAEGMGSRHRDMPQIQFSEDQVAAILDYLGSVAGVLPETRSRITIPGETPP